MSFGRDKLYKCFSCFENTDHIKYVHTDGFISSKQLDFNGKALGECKLKEKYTNIKILKVLKKNPTQLFDNNNPYFNLYLSLNDYMNYYDIKSNHCDIIIKLL